MDDTIALIGPLVGAAFVAMGLIAIGFQVYLRLSALQTTRKTKSKAAGDWDQMKSKMPPVFLEALDTLGLDISPATPSDNLRAWSRLIISDGADVADVTDGDALMGLTGRGSVDDFDVSITLSMSRKTSFSDVNPRLGILWRVKIDGASEQVGIWRDRLRWGDDSVMCSMEEFEDSALEQLFPDLPTALATLEDHGAIRTWSNHAIIEGGDLLFYASLKTSFDPNVLRKLAERGVQVASAITWPEGWSTRHEVELGILERVTTDDPIFDALIEHLHEQEDTKEHAITVLVARALDGDGHAVHRIGQRVPEAAERLPAQRLVAFIESARAARALGDATSYDTTWAIPFMSADEWLGQDAPRGVRADIVTALVAQGEDTEKLRDELCSIYASDDFERGRDRSLRLASKNNPVLVRAVVSDLDGFTERLSRDLERDHGPAKDAYDYVMLMMRKHALRLEHESGIEHFLVSILVDVPEDARRLSVIKTLGWSGTAHSVPVLRSIVDGSLLGLEDDVKKAEEALAAIIERVGDVAHGGLSIVEEGGPQGGLSVAAPGGALNLKDE